MKEELLTAYVTKYALTKGIIKTRGTVSESGYFYYGRWYWVRKDHWFTDENAARAKAEKMRKAKLASLEKQISKLRDYEIKVVEEGL